MKIKEGIKLLNELEHQEVMAYAVEYRKAIKLGIEALKRIDYCRSGEFEEPFELLSTETKD